MINAYASQLNIKKVSGHIIREADKMPVGESEKLVREEVKKLIESSEELKRMMEQLRNNLRKTDKH